MSSAKSSRSRASAQSAPLKGGGANGQDEIAEKLKAFKTDKFDPDAFLQSKCQSMNEKVRFTHPQPFFLFFRLNYVFLWKPITISTGFCDIGLWFLISGSGWGFLRALFLLFAGLGAFGCVVFD